MTGYAGGDLQQKQSSGLAIVKVALASRVAQNG